jgi:DNA polymerase
MRVYDLTDAGPRNRFMIHTEAGPLLVHNCILGLGFGMGAPKFKDTWRVQTAAAGFPSEIDLLEAERIVNLYRSKNRAIRDNGWKFLQNHIPAIANGQAEGTRFGPCVMEKQAILLPTGLRLHYEGLHYMDGEWWFTYAGKPKKLYGGKLLENCVQALDRVLVMEAAVRIQARTGLRLAHQVHDELVYVVPKEQVPEFRAVIKAEMERRPAWGLDLPLAAETGAGPNFGQVSE